MLSVLDDEVLLAKRNKEPRKDGWSIPGGAQELGGVEDKLAGIIQEHDHWPDDILTNIFGTGDAAKKIADILLNADLSEALLYRP